MAKNENYFKSQKVELWLSQSDIDIIKYAINHIAWEDYNADDYDGEDNGLLQTIPLVLDMTSINNIRSNLVQLAYI